jgi:hypothetical protein
VLIFRVAAAGEEPDRSTDEGDKVHDMPPLLMQLRATVPVNPPSGVKVIVEVPDCPGAEMSMVEGFNETPKSVTLIVAGAEVEPA